MCQCDQTVLKELREFREEVHTVLHGDGEKKQGLMLRLSLVEEKVNRTEALRGWVIGIAAAAIATSLGALIIFAVVTVFRSAAVSAIGH